MADRSGLEDFRGTQATLDADREADIRRRLQDRLASSNADDQGQRPFQDRAPVVLLERRRRPARLAYVAAAAAVLLVLVTGGVLASREDQRDLVTGAVGTEVTVADLATIARSRVPATLDEGEELYTEVEETTVIDETGAQPVLERRIRERWTRPDGTGREVFTEDTANGTATATAQADQPGGYDFAGMTLAELEALPSDPQALLETLRDAGLLGDGSAELTAWKLADLLSLPVTPPPVRAAAIEALGSLGAEVVHTPTGVELRGAPTGGGYPWVIAMNPASAEVTGFGFEAPPPGAPTRWIRLYLGAQVVPGS